MKELLNTSEIITNEHIEIELQDIQSTLKDGIQNELPKYRGESLIQQLTQLIGKRIFQHRIPNERGNSTTILLFKRVIRNFPRIIEE